MDAPSISAKQVQELRQATGAGMMDAKKALQRSGGDFEDAAKLLREEGKAGTLKRTGRDATEGAVALVVDGGVGAIVELRCETDFVAKSAEFVPLVEELAASVAADGQDAALQRSGDVEKLAATLKENISLGQIVRYDASQSQDSVVDGYLHIQNERGVNAVLVEISGGERATAHDIAVHIAFARPLYLNKDDVPLEAVQAERETIEALTRKEGKPEAALPKIVEGRLEGWFKERVLLEQSWVRDEKKTVGQLLGSAKLVRFAQVVVGG